MQRITLTEEQSQILAESKDNVEVYDSTGQLVSFLKWYELREAEVIARHLRRRGLPKEPGIPSAQVQAHLRKLEEISQREELDEAKVRDILRRLRAGEGAS